VLVRTNSGADFPHCINIRFEGNLNIQAWWNFGLNYAIEHGARYIAVLNDDVLLRPNTLQAMLSQMIVDSSCLAIPVEEGAAGWGHCWILDSSHGVMPDERFIW
jgi:GT2 family glycosyltransferase